MSNRNEDQMETTKTTPTDTALIEDAIAADQAAEAAEAAHSSPHRWRQADDYLELRERGYTCLKIAARCGVSEITVSRFIRCARAVPKGQERPSFWHAYREVRADKEKEEREELTDLERLGRRIDRYVNKQLEQGRHPDQVYTELSERLDRAMNPAIAAVEKRKVKAATEELYKRLARERMPGKPFEVRMKAVRGEAHRRDGLGYAKDLATLDQLQRRYQTVVEMAEPGSLAA
jgi:hypothetical protein